MALQLVGQGAGAGETPRACGMRRLSSSAYKRSDQRRPEGLPGDVRTCQPDVQTVIHRLTNLHERHAAEQGAELARLRDAGKEDSSVQGTVNKVVVILRDWLSDIDRDVLPAARDGEESLRDEYVKALHDTEVSRHPSVTTLLKTQMDAISGAIDRLPKD